MESSESMCVSLNMPLEYNNNDVSPNFKDGSARRSENNTQSKVI